MRYRDRAIISDLDQNLLGNPDALKEFSDVIKEKPCVHPDSLLQVDRPGPET